ncbi:MAG TPA: PadR family transcriptional regulator [Candidatus Saccharimonadales bacterium]
MNTSNDFLTLRKGLLELVVLKLIAARKVYAADILQQLGKTDFATQEGTLYPLLSKLRRDNLVAYEWVESDAGPPRKYYSLADDGKVRLKELEAYWQKISTTINGLGA